jgi:hypothetical protein
VLTTPFTEVLDRHLTHWRPDGEFPKIVVAHPIQNAASDVLNAQADLLARLALGFLPPG